MAAKPETTFYESVHRHLPPPSLLHREKMSNPYRGGTADYWYDGPETDLWIEWKFIVVPKRDDTVISLVSGKKPTLSALQQDWLRGRVANGRRVAVVVGSKTGGVWFGNTSWGLPFTAGEFRSLIKSRAALADQIVAITGHR